MRTGVDTKNLILNEAEALFRGKGFNGFSYADIARPLGIRNAAVHYHFATKADLGVALIERYRELLRTSTDQFMHEGGDARTQLEGYFRFMLAEHAQGDVICPIGIMAADYHTVPEAMRERGRLLAEETLTWLTRVLEVGREQGAFRFVGPAADKAVCIKATTQGAGQLSRLSGKPMLQRAINQIRRDLGVES